MLYLNARPRPSPIIATMRPISLIAILFWLLAGEPAKAAAFEPLTDIRNAALAHAQAALPAGAHLNPSRMDERLRLPACAEPLATRTASDSGSALSVEVRCDSAGWKLFVPVGVSVQVPVLVMTRALARGQRVSASDVEVQRRERAGLGSIWLTAPEEIAGRVLSRPLAAGAVLTPSALVPAQLIKRGQSVMLIGENGGFSVRAEGRALDDAAAGESVRVQNLSSRRVVQGEVQADGTVRVNL